MRVSSRRFPAFLGVGALALTAAACGSSGAATTTGGASGGSGAFPVTVAAGGATVHITARPHAIISLSPTATEMLYAIGAGSQVKAVDSDSTYPPSAPRTKLSGLQPNIEAIVADKPDLVVVSYDGATLASKLAPFHIPVLYQPAAATLADVYTQLQQLGRATGHLAAARREDVALGKQIDAIVAAAPKPAKPISYYYELDQTYYSITSDTFVGRLLALLGLKSIADSAKGAAASGGYPQLSSEYILKANPDYIVLADTLCCHQDAATIAKRPGWSGLTAVKRHHVIMLNDDIASRWGPRLVDLLKAVAAGLSANGGK